MSSSSNPPGSDETKHIAPVHAPPEAYVRRTAFVESPYNAALLRRCIGYLQLKGLGFYNRSGDIVAFDALDFDRQCAISAMYMAKHARPSLATDCSASG